MKEYFEEFDGIELFDDVMEGADEMVVEERLAYIQLALDNACDLLQRLVECALEKAAEEKAEKKAEAKSKAAEFKIGKLGADLGQSKEKAQQDCIARIFGNM